MGEDQALGRLHEILTRPEFQVDQSIPWWQQLLAPVGSLLTYALVSFLQFLLDAANGGQGWTGFGVLVVCIVLFAVVLVYLFRSIRLAMTSQNLVSTVSLAERRERSDSLWQTAQQLAAAGQFAEALRVLYLSGLYALDEHALLHVQSSLTNREHARQLNELHPTLGPTFSEIVERYDRARYGRVPVTERAFSELSGLVARARSATLLVSTP